jgi:vancomycin resistance protein VanW
MTDSGRAPGVRAVLRRLVPRELRLAIRQLRRNRADARSGRSFASTRGDPAAYPFELCRYERRFVDYPGQGQAGAAKRRNQAILASHLSGVVIKPGEIFSIWRLAPRPSRRQGYGEAAAFRNGKLVLETGGAICLLSTVVYNLALLGGLRVVERHSHSTDTYAEARYFELGRDAAIEFGYRDLRFSNPHDFPVLVQISQSDERLAASLQAATSPPFEAAIETFEPELRQLEDGARVLRVKTLRTLQLPGGEEVTERLPDSTYRLLSSVVTPSLLDGNGGRQLR